MLVQTFLDYERVVAYHGYRRDQPWDNGGALILTMDREDPSIKEEERRLIDSMGANENHHGWTVAVVGGGRSYPVMLRFSDYKMAVWLMPLGWRGVGAPVLSGNQLYGMFHEGAPELPWTAPERWEALARKIGGT